MLSFLLFILNCLDVAVCKLQHSLGRDILLNKDLTMNSKFEPN